MRVRLLVEITGTRDGEPWPPLGDVVDLPDAEATDLVRGGLAVEASDPRPASDSTPVETAATVAPETAAEPAPRPRKTAARRKSPRSSD